MTRTIFMPFFVCAVIWSTRLPAQPEGVVDLAQDSELVAPEGFEVQRLKYGGEVLKPVGWKFDTVEKGGTLAYMMSPPLPDNASKSEVNIALNVITNVKKAGKKPSKFAESYLEELAETGNVIERFEPESKDGGVHSGLLMEGKLNITGEEKDYRIRYAFFADDENGLLYYLEYGGPASDWSKLEPIFGVITERIKMLDLTADN